MNLNTPLRPRSVTLTLWGTLALSVWNAGRVLALLAQRPAAQTLDLVPDPRLRLALALVWAASLAGGGVALLQKRPLARRLLPLLLAAHAFTEIGLLLLYGQSPLNQARWFWMAGLLLGWLLFSTWALTRPAAIAHLTPETIGGEAAAPPSPS